MENIERGTLEILKDSACNSVIFCPEIEVRAVFQSENSMEVRIWNLSLKILVFALS